MKSYPAILIGRLGVDKKFKGNGIGRQLMNFIKSYCLITFGNKCRFIIVDSYNQEKPLCYYTENGFKHIFSSEEQERISNGLQEGESLSTRSMYFDLLDWKNAKTSD
jgi:GNAT superfamily N-acetyltransferase